MNVLIYLLLLLNSAYLIASLPVDEQPYLILPAKFEYDNVSKYTKEQQLLLHHLLYDEWQKAEALIKKGTDVSAIIDDKLHYPLYYAQKAFNKKIIKLLLEKGAKPIIDARMNVARGGPDLTIEDINFENLLMAIINNDVKACKDLLTESNVNEHDMADYTALDWATILDRTEIAKLLINKGAHINDERANWIGSRRLYMALKNNHKDIAQLLISNGADLNYSSHYRSKELPFDEAPLVLAILHSDCETINTIINAGILCTDLNSRSAILSSAPWENIRLLIMRGWQFTSAEFLKSQNSRKQEIYNLCKFSLEHQTAKYIQCYKDTLAHFPENIEKYLEKVKTMGELDLSLIIKIAAIFGQKHIIDYLIQKNISFSFFAKQDQLGRTPLMYALIHGHKELAIILIRLYEIQDELIEKNQKETVIYENKDFVVRGYNDIYHQYIETAKAMNLQDKKHNSALFYSVLTNDANLVERILKTSNLSTAIFVKTVKLAAQLKNQEIVGRIFLAAHKRGLLKQQCGNY